MTLYELSLEYQQTACVLHTRIVELEQARAQTEGEEQRQLDGRLRPLRSMYRDVRAVARHLEGYYQKAAPRRRTVRRSRGSTGGTGR